MRFTNLYPIIYNLWNIGTSTAKHDTRQTFGTIIHQKLRTQSNYFLLSTIFYIYCYSSPALRYYGFRSLKPRYCFEAVPESSIQINCRQLTHNDIEVKEIWTDDSDYDEIVNTRDNKVKSTTTYGGSLHGKGEGKKGVTQLPGRGQGGDKKKNKGKDGGIGKENESKSSSLQKI